MLVRLRRSKITCSSSYVDYRPKTNAVILLDTGHRVREDCSQELYGMGSNRKTWMLFMSALYGNEYRNLKLAETTMGRVLGSSVEDCLSLSQTSKNTIFFLLYFRFFSSTKSENKVMREVAQVIYTTCYVNAKW
jgi:hypothetical protein